MQPHCCDFSPRSPLPGNPVPAGFKTSSGRLKRPVLCWEAFIRSVCWHLVAAFALLCCSHASAAPYPTQDQLRAAIGEIAWLLKNEGLELEILNAQKYGLTRPLMAARLNLPINMNVCLIFYNTKPEGGFNQYFDAIDQKDLPVMLNAIAVHEATHCIEQREVFVRMHFDKVLPPDLKGDNSTIQGYMSVAKSGALVTWSEALADIASVLYLQQVVPSEWARLSNGIAAMRHGLARKWPRHDTSAWLYQIIAADIDEAANQSLFETAFQLRSRYRPSE